MSWFLFALLAAFSESLKDLFSKKGLESVQPHVAALAASAFSFPILLGFFLFTSGIPLIGPRYWEALLWGGALNVLAFVQFMRALKASDLSFTIPFITFTPIFLLFSSPWLVGESPGSLGLLGILLIVGGSYILSVQGSNASLLAPFFAIVKEPGPRRMLSVAAIYGLTSNFDKIGVLNSSPLFWSLSINIFMVLGLFVTHLFIRAPLVKKGPHVNFPLLLLIGFFSATTLIAHNMALSTASVPAVIAIKRTSVLFAVLWGFWILREPNIRQRFFGATLMVIGIGLVAIAIDEGE
ncbi:MAG: EamA family transporter [Nitrospirales bacterium]|nr:EamA family transporter [Nitrospira sp.]MDR4501736.1 EamA family transporter [Nitrospirales bacterium]